MKSRIYIALLSVLAVAACQKEELSQIIQENTAPELLIIGDEEDYGTSQFDDTECQSNGSVADCCPTPASDCSRTLITVTSGLFSTVSSVQDNDSSSVVYFFANANWSACFPLLIGEEEILTDLDEGNYTWTKRFYGDILWVEFVGQTEEDNFSLSIISE